MIINFKLAKIRVRKESGNLYVKDENKVSRPVLFGLYGPDDEPIGLRDYANLRELPPNEALNELTKAKAVLMGNTFQICFYEEKDIEVLLDLIKKNRTSIGIEQAAKSLAEAYHRVFDENHQVKLCGRDACTNLVAQLHDLQHLFVDVDFGSSETGVLNVDQIYKSIVEDYLPW